MEERGPGLRLFLVTEKFAKLVMIVSAFLECFFSGFPKLRGSREEEGGWGGVVRMLKEALTLDHGRITIESLGQGY